MCVCANERVGFIRFHEFLCGHHPAICHGIWGANRPGKNVRVYVCDCEYTLFLTGLRALSIWFQESDATFLKHTVYQQRIRLTFWPPCTTAGQQKRAKPLKPCGAESLNGKTHSSSSRLRERESKIMVIRACRKRRKWMGCPQDGRREKDRYINERI